MTNKYYRIVYLYQESNTLSILSFAPTLPTAVVTSLTIQESRSLTSNKKLTNDLRHLKNFHRA